MTHGNLLHLKSGQWELEVEPARGGAVTALRHRGRDVLVSPSASTEDAMGSANFVLAPYANRIAHGRFKHAGREWTLLRNFGDHAHPLHGTGWKRAWAVVDGAPQAVRHQALQLVMQLEHAADAHWPWAFEATQRIYLSADVMRHELAVINRAGEAAPMGVGFHPAFAACAATTFSTQLEGVWKTDADSLPVGLVPASEVLPDLPAAVHALREQLVDHCFMGWSRDLRIDHAGHAGELNLVLSASPELDFLQLYMPPGKRWFCAEPMSQMPDAINRHAAAGTGAPGTGLRLLAPGESFSVWMEVLVQE
jgi:aldose 1-epimerase